MAKLSQAHPPNPERAAAAAAAGGLPLRELLAILRRRRRVIVWVAADRDRRCAPDRAQVKSLYRDRPGDGRAAREPDRQRREGRAGPAARGQRGHRDPHQADPVACDAGARGRRPEPRRRAALVPSRTRAQPSWRTGRVAGRTAARLARRSAAGALGLAAGITSDGARGSSRRAARAGDRRAAERREGHAVGALLRPLDQLHRRRPEEAARIANGIAEPTSTCSSTRSSRPPAAPASGSPSRSSSCAGGVRLRARDRGFRAANGLVDTDAPGLDRSRSR